MNAHTAFTSPALALILIALVAVVASAVLASMETALTRLSRAYAQDMIDEGVKNARIVDELLAQRDRTMLVLRAVRTVWQVVMAVASTIALANLPLTWWALGLIAAAVVAIVQFFAVSVIGVWMGRRRPERAARMWARTTRRLVRLFRWCDPIITRIRGRLPQPTQTEAEARAEVANDLREMVDQVGETEGLEAEDRQMLRSVFELGHTLVREIMTPRIDIVSVDAGQSAQEALNTCIASGYSRLPVVGDDVDDVRGVVYFKDLVRRLENADTDAELLVDQVMRPAEYTIEMKAADDLLRHLQARHRHMALVVDEYGGISGVVTLEDLLEELVGELTDEHDHATAEPEQIDPLTWRVPAKFSKDDLGDLLGIELVDDDVDSVGGLLSKAIDRVPEPGDSGEILGLRLVAEADPGQQNEVGLIVAHKLTPDTPETNEEDPSCTSPAMTN